MDNDEIAKKRSLGALRKAPKTKARSPDLTGKLKLQRHTLETVAKQLEGTHEDEIICNIAGWANHDHQGPYLTVELSPWFVSRETQTPQRSNLSFFLIDEEET